MVLSKNSLPQYFEIATPQTTHYKKPCNTYDVRIGNNPSLCVTIGESWTYGSDISERLKHVYGSVLSRKLDADWLNLGIPSAGNLFVRDKVSELVRIISLMPYDKIYVVCLLTEAGRELDSSRDNTVDYHTWFNNNINVYTDYYKFFAYLTDTCVESITRELLPFGHVQLVFATNFVEQAGVINQYDNFLQDSWVKMLCDQDNK